jgi:branched-chain amino acid transport system ATP-binding protein
MADAGRRALRVDGVSAHYGRVQALREVSLRVDEGEIVTIIGANGAGKTTLLNAIASVVPASAGSISWGDTSLSALRAHQVVRAGVGYVPEGRELFRSLSVLDNLLLGAWSSGEETGLRRALRLTGPSVSFGKRPEVAAGLDRAFRLFPRLDERRAQQAGSLSGGEQQMLAIARALMSHPSLLMLDEPSIGLAPSLVPEVLRLLRQLRDEGLTILLVEQDAVAALRTSDRGYVLERGSIVMEGPSSQLLNTDRVRRAYLGRAAERSWRDQGR